MRARRDETDRRSHWQRSRQTTYAFPSVLRNRMAAEHRFQLKTDGLVFYREGVEDVLAGTCDFAQMIKLCCDYGRPDVADRDTPALRLSARI